MRKKKAGKTAMRQNKYDDPAFFTKYAEMPRSRDGLQSAGEWPELEKLLPPFFGMRVLDLGCGYGWHCIYALEHGAASVTGVDLSEKMLAVAREKTASPNVTYLQTAIEDADFAPGSFDIVISSLALHYVWDFEAVCKNVSRWLNPGGRFVFSVEHPVFTAEGSQAWVDDETGAHRYWPVDRYFFEGQRESVFLGERVTKYHRTVTGYVHPLLQNGFFLNVLVEPKPPDSFLSIPGMADELRRPMMLLFSCTKQE